MSKAFGPLVAVKGISFRVMKGECFGILGPNGAGKTSTIRMIYGFSPSSGGSLNVFGMESTVNQRAIKARIGVCQQDNNLDPDLTVFENLMVFARYFDIPLQAGRRKAEQLMAFMALDHRRDAQVGELSGGDDAPVDTCARLDQRSGVINPR